jgi:hypothetical protein
LFRFQCSIVDEWNIPSSSAVNCKPSPCQAQLLSVGVAITIASADPILGARGLGCRGRRGIVACIHASSSRGSSKHAQLWGQWVALLEASTVTNWTPGCAFAKQKSKLNLQGLVEFTQAQSSITKTNSPSDASKCWRVQKILSANETTAGHPWL